MRNGRYAAFIVDLDGTLIGRDERISPRVAEAMRKVSKHIGVSIATGRETADVLRFAKQLGLTIPQISDNGALLLDPATGRDVWSAPLGPMHARHIVSTLISQRVAFIATHAGGSVTSAAGVTHWNMTRVSALDLEEAAAQELVTYFSLHPELHVVKVFLPYNGLWAVDFTRNGVTKATALSWLGLILGIDPASMIAAGDSYNDLPMLRACGLRIVMGHAPDELKALADYVAPPVDEDGLAVAIEEFILPRL
jgi:hydroxymethylpyrimidine pyrophosphatase-like HAD family hydrolase